MVKLKNKIRNNRQLSTFVASFFCISNLIIYHLWECVLARGALFKHPLLRLLWLINKQVKGIISDLSWVMFLKKSFLSFWYIEYWFQIFDVWTNIKNKNWKCFKSVFMICYNSIRNLLSYLKFLRFLNMCYQVTVSIS